MSEERLPPHDLGAEENVLGAILLDGEQVAKVDLVVSDFFDESHQAIYEAMVNLRKAEAVIDQITVAHELQRMGKIEMAGGASYLSHLVATIVVPWHALHYAKIVKECSVNRSLIAAAGQIAAAGYEAGDPSQNIATSWGILRKVGQMINDHHLLTPSDIAKMADERYEALRHITPGLGTGIKALDKLMGGVSDGDYIILASRPGMGKTTFALQMAQNIAAEHTVLFASLEMMPEAIIDKIVASFAGKPVRVVRRGNYPNELLDEIVFTFGKLNQLKLYLYHGAATVASLRQSIEQMQASYGLELVFLDYLHLLRDRYGSNTNERIGFISGELATIAKEFSMPLIVLSQLSRAPDDRMDKRPHLSDLRESGSIEQDADLIMFLYRDSYYNRGIEVDGAETELIIAKDRLRGITGKLKLYWDSEGEKYVEGKREGKSTPKSPEPAGKQMGMV